MAGRPMTNPAPPGAEPEVVFEVSGQRGEEDAEHHREHDRAARERHEDRRVTKCLTHSAQLHPHGGNHGGARCVKDEPGDDGN